MNPPRYPWYDALWLNQYVAAREFIRERHPERLESFVRAFDVLRTRPDFQVREFDRVFEPEVLQQIKNIIQGLPKTEVETHEILKFGRFVVHDHPYLTELQQSVQGLVSEAAGEPVEPLYNFLSLYTKLGQCPVHLDAPEAKWTLDLCIDQSEPWPIHFSQIQPWPCDLDEAQAWGDGWADLVKADTRNRFQPYMLQPGKAILFSGSSQWHYRDRLARTGGSPFCHLMFFHYIPRGTKELIRPRNWPRLFELPDLEQVIAKKSGSRQFRVADSNR